MGSYENFARVYDELMDNVPYEEWAQFILNLLQDRKITEGLVLELGCGTGKLMTLLGKAGFDMIGVDNSVEMLQIAREKTSQDFLYLLQDMREFELYGTVKAVISVCDSVNYITKKEELRKVFQLVNNYLDPEGLFIFDFNTEYKYRELIGETVIAEDREDVSFIWFNEYDEESHLNDIDLKVFVQEEGDIYQKFQEEHIQRGYTLDDRVGISYLEYQYEDYLRGTKAKYRLLSDNSYELVSEGKRGNDIVLTIDIELQKYLEEVLSNEVLNAKGEPGTQYYNRSFAIVSDPNTGEILAMAGKQAVLKDGYYQIVDYTPGIVTLPVTPGSVVKGASMMVGYKYGAIDIGTVLNDECIKIKDTPLKCSWQTMGPIDDVYALQNSSNVYQYKIAIKVGNGSYEYNQGLVLDESAFDKYREMYAEFGLGEKTGIDLPVESLGFMGKSRLPGHLLDFSIGQYDTYTPIQLSQYINTIANNGVRLKPYLLKEVYKPSDSGDTFGSLIYKANVTELGKLSVEKKYIDRVREGFSAVVTKGLGYGYMGNYTNSAGKTGTSQSFIDTDGDGKVDTETITSSFVGYSPSDNPKMSIVVVSPDISVPDSTTYGVTRNISAQIVNKYFELNG